MVKKVVGGGGRGGGEEGKEEGALCEMLNLKLIIMILKKMKELL